MHLSFTCISFNRFSRATKAGSSSGAICRRFHGWWQFTELQAELARLPTVGWARSERWNGLRSASLNSMHSIIFYFSHFTLTSNAGGRRNWLLLSFPFRVIDVLYINLLFDWLKKLIFSKNVRSLKKKLSFLKTHKKRKSLKVRITKNKAFIVILS